MVLYNTDIWTTASACNVYLSLTAYQVIYNSESLVMSFSASTGICKTNIVIEEVPLEDKLTHI